MSLAKGTMMEGKYNAHFRESWSIDDQTMVVIEYTKQTGSHTWHIHAMLDVGHAGIDLLRTQASSRNAVEFDAMLRFAREKVETRLSAIAATVARTGGNHVE
jgi:hypothetical protein